MTTDPRQVLDALAELVAPLVADRLRSSGTAPASTAWLSPEQVAVRVGKHVDTVRAMLRAGTLPGRKVGSAWRTDPDELARYFAARDAAQRKDRRRTTDASAWLKAEKAKRRAGA